MRAMNRALLIARVTACWLAAEQPALRLLVEFNGIDGQGVGPPDPTMGAGPTSVVLGTNQRVRIRVELPRFRGRLWIWVSGG